MHMHPLLLLGLVLLHLGQEALAERGIHKLLNASDFRTSLVELQEEGVLVLVLSNRGLANARGVDSGGVVLGIINNLVNGGLSMVSTHLG